ncbi:MAG: tRNA pseudouridine(38-40) synthase TruA [Ignavibacteriae bacterium]|nr:tRNA pseudouridine(38-40) synthase TruA [Ignavibacteriota bacterium]
MRNIKLTLEYDGTDFVGWQSQTNGRNVQDEITKVLDQVLQEPITLVGAGRTDSGVHARGQVANFKTNSSLGVSSILNALNGTLPEDIYVHAATEVNEKFHARFDARERLYKYYISLIPSAIGRQYHWYVKYDLDLSCMNEVAAMLLGEHDFESFTKAEALVPHHRCTILKSEWTKTSTMPTYEIRANRFLHGMVRALVGTMVDIGRGYIPISAFENIMAAKDRRKAGMAVPPNGLFLEEVTY